MDISVVIVNYNTCQLTCRCLDSIIELTKGVQYEVIVVDNDSQKDESKQVLSQYPGIQYIQSETNLGFGKANNLGFSYATGRYILFLNSDTYLLNDALSAFVHEMDNLPDYVACAGAPLLAEDGTANQSYAPMPTLLWYAKAVGGLYIKPFVPKRSAGNVKSTPQALPMEVPYVIGADLCIRREVIERYGLFDPDFFMYYEESEMQNRYQRHGYKSYLIASPQIVHLEGASYSRNDTKHYPARVWKWYMQSQALFFKKTQPYYKYLIYRIISLLSAPLCLRSYYSMREKRMLMKTLLCPITVIG